MLNEPLVKPKERFKLIDTVRGFSFICMVFYHLLFDLVYIYNVKIPLFDSDIIKILQQMIVFSFVFISGISVHFSRNKLKNGIIIFLCGLILTLVTFVFIPSQFIAFGILHMLGLCGILTALFYDKLIKIPPAAGIILSVLFFLITENISSGYISLLNFKLYLPKIFYDLKYSFPFGFYDSAFHSSDYYPLFPWAFIYFTGLYYWLFVKNFKIIYKINRLGIPVLNKAGEYTLIGYMLHQPVIYIILFMLNTLKII